MALDDVKHVEAVAIIRALVERPDVQARDAALGWLEDNHPNPEAYAVAARSLGKEPDEPVATTSLTCRVCGVEKGSAHGPCLSCGKIDREPEGMGV